MVLKVGLSEVYLIAPGAGCPVAHLAIRTNKSELTVTLVFFPREPSTLKGFFMSRTLSKLTIAAGAAALALAPVAASAGTRASDDANVYTSSVSQPGNGREAEGENVGSGLSIVSLLVGAYLGVWTTLFVKEITEDDNFQSAGT